MSDAGSDEVRELERAAARRIRDEHAAILEGTAACADRVVDAWDDERTSDRRAVVTPLERCLDSSGLLARLPDVLADAVDATGYELSAPPVPAPPYIVVASRGPVLRATIDPGRLVIRFDVFEVRRGPTTEYRPLDELEVVVSLE